MQPRCQGSEGEDQDEKAEVEKRGGALLRPLSSSCALTSQWPLGIDQQKMLLFPIVIHFGAPKEVDARQNDAALAVCTQKFPFGFCTSLKNT